MIATAVLAPPSKPEFSIPREPIWRLSIAQYHEMIRAKILTEDDPVELLQGWLVVKMSKNPPHSSATRLLRKALEGLLPTGWFVDTQEPITTIDSEPEPDVFVARGSERDYSGRHPEPNDLALIVEVADSSLERDRTIKRLIYAQAKIAFYWILNLSNRQLEVYSSPSATIEQPDYAQRQVFPITDEVPLILDGSEIGRLWVKDLLP